MKICTTYTIFLMEQAAILLMFMFLACTTTTMVQCTKNIFILAGQSNMVGEGGTSVVPPECQPNPQIFRLNNNSQWEVAREPLHLGMGLKSQSCGIGPGMAFATSIVKPGETIGLIPCAVVASYIDEWKRGTKYYNWTLSLARAAVSNGGETVRAMLWYQGESESLNISNAKSYGGKLAQFFTDIRNDLQSPSLPIIQVAIAKGYNFTQIVRDVQLNMALPNVYCVDTLKLNVTVIPHDDLHLDTQSQVKLGKALAAVYRNISAPYY